MKIKAFIEGVLAGLILAVLSYPALISRATVTTIAMRRKMPEAGAGAATASGRFRNRLLFSVALFAYPKGNSLIVKQQGNAFFVQ